MLEKNQLRAQYFRLRKKKYFEITKEFFLPIKKLLRSYLRKKNFKIALYYPSNYEINVLKLLENKYLKNTKILIPLIEESNFMNFYPWKKNEVLLVNKFGLLEPVRSKAQTPDVILVPILSFDKKKYRLGYGKGFYDRYLNKYLKNLKNIITVGVAFSFKRHHKLPITKKDVKLDYILTEKGLIK